MENKYKEYNGTSYHKETSEEVIQCLDQLLNNRERVRIWYGKNGKSWNEEYDILGYIGRSTGENKIPLLINNSRSYGGGALLDDSIVKIVRTSDNRTIWQHKKFSQAKFTFKDNKVFIDGKAYAPHCKNNNSAKNLCAFMNGERNSK